MKVESMGEGEACWQEWIQAVAATGAGGCLLTSSESRKQREDRKRGRAINLKDPTPPLSVYTPIHAPHPYDPRPPARVYLWKVHILPQQHHQLGARSSNPGGFVFKPYYLPLGGLLCTREEEGYNALTKALS